jgi:ACS family glucarate transporter-like MFS transporter
VSAGVMEAWFRPQRWALLNGLQSMALQIAAAFTPPLVAYLMHWLGWQHSLFWPELPVIALIVLWGWYARDTPAQHPDVTPTELAELGESARQAPTTMSWRRLRCIVADRSILLLAFSYICMNYVFYLIANWCFLYLVQQRHFNILESGMLAAAPPFAAAIGAGVGGILAPPLCERFGVSYGVIELTEGSYWAATMYIARADSMTATGVLNTGGNLGGLIGIPIVAYLSGSGAWTAAFVVGTLFAFVGAACWLGVDASKSFGAEPGPAKA